MTDSAINVHTIIISSGIICHYYWVQNIPLRMENNLVE